MFGYARLRLFDAESAEEAVQEALLAAWRSRDSFRGNSSERTWLIGILRHKVLDAISERVRKSRAESAEKFIDAADPAFSAGQFVDIQHQWGGEIDPVDLRNLLIEALETLPEQMRQAVVLREIDGLSGRVVCEIMGISETNLWTLVHRAKTRLRVCLDKHFETE